MKKTILLLFLVFSNVVFSQKISGFLLDSKTKKPIYKAHIKVDKKIFLSDKKGFFSFVLKNSKRITISHIKYQTKSVEIKTKNRVKILLTEKRESLKEIKVVSKKLQDKIQYKELQDFPHSVYSFGSVLKDDKILIFAGDASFIGNSMHQEKSKVFFSGINEAAAFFRYATMPKYKDILSYKNDVLIFDLNKNEWKIAKEKVRKRANLNAALVNEKVYLLGGKKRTRTKQYLDDKIEIYDLKKGSISIDDVNPHQTVNFGTSVYKNKIIVSGGSTKIKQYGGKMYSEKVHFFDTDSGYWYLLTTMKKGKETKTIIVKNELYFFGGYREENLKEIESYNLSTDTWKNEGTLFKKLGRPAVTKNKETIYLFENKQLLTFNTITKELKEYKINVPFFEAEMFYNDGFLYIFGGYKNSNSSTLASKKIVKISLDEFKKTKNINQKIL